MLASPMGFIANPNNVSGHSVNHDHNTGYIRGILTEKINWLESQWEIGTYGQLTKPVELTEYQNNPPAYDVIGKIFYN